MNCKFNDHSIMDDRWVECEVCGRKFETFTRAYKFTELNITCPGEKIVSSFQEIPDLSWLYDSWKLSLDVRGLDSFVISTIKGRLYMLEELERKGFFTLKEIIDKNNIF
jgi:hypothetical protein